MESEIDHHASEQGLRLTDEEKEEVARRFMNAIAWALNSYDEWLHEAVREVNDESFRRLKGGDKNGKQHTRNSEA